jgi:alkylation response protein AidB-like acyl-CoA dehydrogenase
MRWPRPAGATRAVYAELAELGLTGLAVPEAHGGLGFGAIEAMVVCEELGRGLVNAPYARRADGAGPAGGRTGRGAGRLAAPHGRAAKPWWCRHCRNVPPATA